jgi:pimeloyl-ACP methyl ester carboxylesterase
MGNKLSIESQFQSWQVEVDGLSIHVVDGGKTDGPNLFFLHGWPEDGSAVQPVMELLGSAAHVTAIDLPGIGGSLTPPPANDKRTIAKVVHNLIQRLGLRDVTLVGQDVGGMVVYAYLRAFPGELARAVIMNVAVPGVDPWSEVVRNPYIWHFAFHNVPNLPETLVTGREVPYFAFFYGWISARPGAVSETARARYLAAYSRPEALHTGFEWYRAFGQDVRDNQRDKGNPIDTPILYLRGSAESGKIDDYLAGFRTAGLRSIQGRIIPECGHYAFDEQPEAVAEILRDFAYFHS